MYSTARLADSLPGLSGIVHSSAQILKPGSPRWLTEHGQLSKPNAAIATQPENTIIADYRKDDLEGQISVAKEIKRNITGGSRRHSSKRKSTVSRKKPQVKRKPTKSKSTKKRKTTAHRRRR